VHTFSCTDILVLVPLIAMKPGTCITLHGMCITSTSIGQERFERVHHQVTGLLMHLALTVFGRNMAVLLIDAVEKCKSTHMREKDEYIKC
jgi:hypothetical protein